MEISKSRFCPMYALISSQVTFFTQDGKKAKNDKRDMHGLFKSGLSIKSTKDSIRKFDQFFKSPGRFSQFIILENF